MAVTYSIPPQAYTKETLAKAIDWMVTQPPSLRERATSADLIVSFYMQACRKANAHIEAPISQEVFKADLRNLAEGLKQFEDPAPPNFAQVPPVQPAVGRFHSYAAEPPLPPPPPPPRSEPVAATWTIDPRSLQVARELQQRLNLSHEVEAIRFLITLGAERARELFP